MAHICILTDSSAQFTVPDFPGQELVHILPLTIQQNSKVYERQDDFPTAQLPVSARGLLRPVVLPPSASALEKAYQTYGRAYDEIIVLLLSTHLNSAVTYAERAARVAHIPAPVYVLDSQSVDLGLGMLVQKAAWAAINGTSGTDIVHALLGQIPHVYTVFGMRGLTYLELAGQIDPAQGMVGEMLGMLPVLTLEHGRLTAVHKARSGRNLVDILYEFISEVSAVEHIALLQSSHHFNNEARSLRERIINDFASIPFSEHTFTPATSALIGPASLGLVVAETDKRRQ